MEPKVKRWWQSMKYSNRARLWMLRTLTRRIGGESEADIRQIREELNEDLKRIFRDESL